MKPRTVLVGRTKDGIAVGIGPGIRLVHFNELSARAALDQLLRHGRLTLPNTVALEVLPEA
jgi:hypothetical protein